MKIVVCENCGAKYQLDDNDDINAFECSSCTGRLKELESLAENGTSDSSIEESQENDSVLVYCKNCGTKFQIDKWDNIDEFECTSCGGPLDYVSNIGDESNQSESSQSNFYENVGYQSESDEIVPIPADESFSGYVISEDEIIPIHAETNSDSYYSDTLTNDEEEENFRIHERQGYVDVSSQVEEIIPIHAEKSNVSVDGDYADSYSDVDEIIPIHAEENYEENNQYYESSLPDIEDLESTPNTFDENQYYSQDYEESNYSSSSFADDNYDSLGGTDEIIPIHAEKRYLETSRDISSGFAYKTPSDYVSNSSSNSSSNDYYDTYNEEYGEESNDDKTSQTTLVDVTDIPEDELPDSPIPLKRQALSEEDEKLFARVQNEMVFDSPEEYEAFKITRYKYYTALMNILKEEYLQSLEKEFVSDNSVKRLIKKGEDSVKHSNLRVDGSDALVSKETVEIMKSNRNYEPKKSNADLIILIGLFLTAVSAIYYFLVSQIMYVLIAVLIGIIILSYGIYKKYSFNEYLARGRIIRERLLALPNDFYVFYAVQPPQSKDIINHVVVGPTGVFTILSKRYESKDYKNRVKSDNETDSMLNESASIQNYMDKKNTLELQTDYEDNQSRFQFGNEEIHFDQNSQIKRKALELNEDLAIFLDKKGFSGIYIEPLIGFVNDDLAILNVILTNEDLFIDELFNKMIRGKRRLDELTVAKIARLLSYYSADCSVY